MGRHLGRRRPLQPAFRAQAGAAVLLVTIALRAAGCSGELDATSAPPASAQGSVATPAIRNGAPHLAAVTPLDRSEPVRVQIPAIGVDSALMDLGLQVDGTLQVPPSAFPAGWYTGSPTPGELGPAVIAGHVHWNEQQGVFEELAGVAVDDEVTVTRTDGSTAVFRVTRVEQFAKVEFPTDVVYGDIDHAGLRLITCGGLDLQSGTYADNTIVFADLVGARTT